ncbi:MAG: hypothetical protein M3Y87_05910 [Myxococcota bacterium]|nr:hypothetical protein [Myxococcota bacterium]
MAVLFSLFVMFAGGLSIAGFIALVLWLGARSRKRTAAELAASVQALGLTLQGEHQASGVRDGIHVRLVLTTESRGSGKNRRTVRVTRYWAHFDPPLRMSLHVGEQTAFFGDLLDLAGLSNDIELGDPALDAALRIKALEPDHARAVLRAADVQRAILAACAAGSFSITDAHAFVQHDGWVTSQGGIASRLEPLWAVARGIAAARRQCRASWEHAIDASWGGLAGTDGLAYDGARSWLGGRVGETTLDLSVQTERGALVTRASATFAAPLGLGMQVYRTGLAQNLGKLFGAQDVQVGVAEFDALYTVKATDADGVRSALAGGGAHALLQLQSIASELTVDDAGVKVRVDGVLHDPRAVAMLVRSLSSAATAMRPGGSVSIGAFR